MNKPAKSSTLSAALLSVITLGIMPLTAGARPDAPEATAAERAAVQQAKSFSLAMQKVSRDVLPAVVSIQALKGGQVQQGRRAIPQQRGNDPFEELLRRHFGGDPNDPPTMRAPQSVSTGSGTIVTADGYILTNNHVVEDATAVKVLLADERTLDAKVVGTDPQTDVAVLKIEGEDFPHAKLGDSDEAGVGQIVLAFGSPFQLNQTVTSGIISAKGRHLSDNDRGNVRTAYEDFLQTDAAINPGNSGGPLVNLDGEVIGVNTAIFTRSGGSVGIGFAIPSSMAKGVMDSLISTGAVKRGYLGVDPQQLDLKTAKMLGFDSTKGVLIASVAEDGPAAKAGLKVEDIVTEIDGKPVRDPNSFRTRIASTGPDKPVTLTVIRAGEKQQVKAVLGDRDSLLEQIGSATADNPLGVAVQNIDGELRTRMGPRVSGVVITEVKRDSAAANMGLQADDVIFLINGTAIRDVESFKAAAATIDIRKGVRLGVRRGNASQIFGYQNQNADR